MAEQQNHPLERRSAMLADALGKRVDLMATMMRPDNRPIFHQRLSEPDAVRFWRQHRFDDLGKAVMSSWTPDQILNLDTRLMQANEADGLG